MPRRGSGVVGGIHAFRPCVDRRDALRPDEGQRAGRRSLDDIRRENSERRIPGNRLRREGDGFCKLYAEKLGTPNRDMVLSALSGRIEEGSRLTHDGAPCHNLLIKRLGLEDDWCKFVPGEREYEEKMKLMSNCCSYLRHCFESHRGIKYAKLEAYANFFMYRWSHVRKHGLSETIDFLMGRVCGTRKSHDYRESFRKKSTWL